MKQSALTLVDLVFLTTRVETDTKFKGSATDFDFDGALIHWGIRHGAKGDDGTLWWVGLNFIIKSEEEKPCPYNIDMNAVAMFAVDEAVAQEKREKMAFENGLALVYGAIREMVSNITSRSAFGRLMLPTASFFDTLEEHNEKKRKMEKEQRDTAAEETETRGN